MAQRAEIILNEARRWIGTPFHHQASICSVGTDCLGLVRGIWRALYGEEPETPPPYAPDWAEATGRETLLNAARRHLREKDSESLAPGDVLLFRLRRNGPTRHCGILSTKGRMIHAWSGQAVAEVPFDAAWQRRQSHVFAFPPLPPPRT
jgi:NlpC/P60 family putative phage cell wall peptidase